ncbi:phospho-sugar mutase [Micropruina sp.]|uniref:phospho-sugar mutase n=1 Tax=Micropruina sp. TaxID=2737536 RepID=UPI0039E21EC2
MTTALGDTLEAQVTAWFTDDPDPATQLALTNLRDRARDGDPAALAELTDAFSGPLSFGTAGLRGALGPGPNRMNRVVVARAAAGLAAHLLDHGHAGDRVIVGYDARYNSDVFATDTAEILAGAGLRPLLCTQHQPTPVVAFGIRHYRCAAGVVVTASHNPPHDNGYKVYLGDGSQIVPPADAEIAAQIARASRVPVAGLRRSDDYHRLGDELVEAYLSRASALVAGSSARELVWVHTALHGVGTEVVTRAAVAAGFPAPHLVEAQAAPDPTFPTVAFPNPEEPGAIDLALAKAVEVGADVAVANDPDADRCALAAPVNGSWRMLSGDELGWLLAAASLADGVRGTYACSVVSSTLLADLAAAHGQPFAQTLTGFKWIARVPGLAFGYEEALGYCTDPAAVADKDGVTALLRVLALAAGLKAEGRNVTDLLDDLARSFGVCLTEPLNYRVADLALIGDAMARLRATPPGTLAGEPVSAVDLARGSDELPPTDGLLFTGERVRAVVRPSGTEPKLKCYLQVRLPPDASHDLALARAEASGVLARLRADLAGALGL